MQSFVVVAFLLASLATANPIESQRRALAYGAETSSTQRSDSSSSSSFTAGGTGYGGGFGGASYYSAHSSTSSSFSSVMNSFSGLSSQIAAVQGMIGGGSFTQAIAYEQMTQIAETMQLALSQSVGCGCFGQDNLISTVSGAFSQFSSLMTSMQSTFGEANFGNLVQPFGALTGSFRSFFHAVSSSGYSTSHVFPPGLSSVLCSAIPGFTDISGFK